MICTHGPCLNKITHLYFSVFFYTFTLLFCEDCYNNNYSFEDGILHITQLNSLLLSTR